MVGKWHKLAKMPAYACQGCGDHVHPMVGTPFYRSHTPLQKWFYAMYLFTTTRHGVPAKELQRQLSVNYKTAYRMAHADPGLPRAGGRQRPHRRRRQAR